MGYEWKGKRVLITGASSGIGEAIAVEIGRRGGIVGLLARREDLLREVASKVDAAGGTARTFPCDVADSGAVSTAAARFRDEFGAVDVMIANAGIGGQAVTAEKIKLESFRAVYETNLIGAINAVAAVLPGMVEQGSGQLVAISSLAGFRGLPKSAAYCSSKAAMTSLFESIRLDVQDRGVSVTVIQPGFIRTPLTSGREAKMPFLMELEDSVPHFLRAIEKRKKFAAFPWQLATVVRAGKFFPTWLYDRIAGRAKYRE